jgi:hypothetical protein
VLQKLSGWIKVRGGGETEKRLEKAKCLKCGRSSVVERQLPKPFRP